MRFKFAAILLAAMAVSVSALASNLDRFYQPNVATQYGALPPTGDVILQPSSGDLHKDAIRVEEEGKAVLGQAAFNGPSASPTDLRRFAKKIGAQYVLYLSKYSNSVAGPTIGTTAFSRFGGLGLVMPSTIDRYEQVYVFMADAPRKGLGIAIRLLTPDDQVQLASNKGVYIVAVRRGSPAFMADILPNDLLLNISGSVVYDQNTLKEAITSAFGTTADIEIVRNGAHIHKTVALSSDGTW